MRCRGVALGISVLLGFAAGCTRDFDAFEVGRGASNADGSASGGIDNSGGSSGASGSDGMSGGVPSGGASGAGGIPSTGSGGALIEGGAGSGGASPGGSGGLPDAGPTCTPTQKLCSGACVSRDAPATGCDSSSCAPCALAHTGPVQCAGGACAPLTCAAGFDDCDTSRSNGCEVDVTTNARDCGGCGNDCTQQNNKVCVQSVCGCTADGQCRSGPQNATIVCDTATNLCHCDAATCQRGESCRQGVCACNQGAACAAGQTCCRSPAGCADLSTDKSNCGACGHACTLGFVCVSRGCQCDADGDCSNGTAGTCTSGLCHCGGTTCGTGERCLANGQCG
jgi:hypothetical protein